MYPIDAFTHKQIPGTHRHFAFEILEILVPISLLWIALSVFYSICEITLCSFAVNTLELQPKKKHLEISMNISAQHHGKSSIFLPFIFLRFHSVWLN